MKHLKFIHALTGILALVALLVEGSVQRVFVEGSTAIQSSVLLLLAATLVNLALGSYLTLFRCKKAYLQALATLLLLAATVISGLELFGQWPQTLPVITDALVVALLTVGVTLHFLINLKALNPNNTTTVDDSDRETGTVKWFNITKGFGFITRDRGDDVFVHYRAIRGEGHRTLSEGQRVEFVVIEKDKGLQAEDVIAAPKGR